MGMRSASRLTCGRKPKIMRTYHIQFDVVVHDNDIDDAIVQARQLIVDKPMGPVNASVYEYDPNNEFDFQRSKFLEYIDYEFGGEE